MSGQKILDGLQDAIDGNGTVRTVHVPERLNPLLTRDALLAADEAACKLDGMFRDLFNEEDRMDLIVTIIRAATRSMLTSG